MLILKNITRNNGIIEADYYTESSEKPGHIAVDIKTGKSIKLNLSPGDENSTAPAHALMNLRRLSTLEKLPVEKKVFWY